MLSGKQVHGTLAGIQRRRNSTNGNASWRLTLHDGRSWTTKTDAQVGLLLGEGWVGDPVTLVVDGRGQVIDAERHGPVRTTWFGVGLWPTCRCGYDPHNNDALTAHWAALGFEVIDDHGHLVRRPLAEEPAAPFPTNGQGNPHVNAPWEAP